MRKSIILVIALMVSAMIFAQKAERDYTTLKGKAPVTNETCKLQVVVADFQG